MITRHAPIAVGLLVLAAGSLDARTSSTPSAVYPPSPATDAPLHLRQDADTSEKRPKKKNLPLEVARTVSIDSDEGSWISLDVSPDGQTIVFDFLGDLYRLPFSGGVATPLTKGMAFDAQPRFSPDGKRVVFTSDRDGGETLWTLDLDTGDTTQVTKGKSNRYQSPEWTPDGKYIVASRAGMRSGSPKLMMWHVDGGSGATLIKTPANLKTTGAAMSEDGRYIWFAERTGNWQYNAIFPQYQLAMYDRETGRRYTRTSRFGSAVRPTLSPDGKWLVYGTRHEAETGLRIRDLESGDERWLVYPVQRDDQESRGTRDVLPGMSFTPDSRELVASYGGKIWRVPIDGGTPIEIPFRVTVDVELGPKVDFDYPVDRAPEFVVRQIRDAVPSPNGTRVVLSAMGRLYVFDAATQRARRLTSGEMIEAQPTWSPDGNWIAYATWSSEGGHIYKVRADGRGRPARLTPSPALYQQLAWAPSGNRIVAIRGAARAFRDATGPFAPGVTDDIVWVSADGGPITLIAPSEGRSRPHFATGGDRLYLHHSQNGLVSIRLDGTDEKAHVKVTGEKPAGFEQPTRASLVMMAPTGDRALAQVGSDIYAVTVPLVGGDTPTISVANPDNAAFPARKLTDIGGQFPTWRSDGRTVHWSIGNAYVTYDIDRAEVFEDSVKAAKKTEEETPEPEKDSEVADDKEDGEAATESVKYQPTETPIEIRATRDIPQGVAVLRGARVISMEGDQVIENADVVVRGNRIESVGRRGTVDVPAGAREIDLSGKTVVPGFVDVHAHLRPAWGIHKSESWAYVANLAYGVTTTRDPQTGTTDVLTYGDRVEAGDMLGPRIYSTGPGVFWQEGIKDLDHAKRVLKRYSQYYDTKTIKMYVAGNRQQRQWIIMAARDQRLMPTTEGSLNLKLNLTQLIDGYPGQEHSFPVFPLYDDIVKLTAEAGMTYTPTLLVAYGGPWAENYFYTRENPHDDEKLRRFTPHEEIDRKTRRRGQGTGPGPGGWFLEDEHVFTHQAKIVNDIVVRGGRAGVGSHGQLQGLGYHWELWAMQSGGMSNHDALRVATIFGAEAIGLDTDLGSIRQGKLADLVILDGNPLNDIRNTNTIRFVMKNGRLYDGNSLDEVWPRQRVFERPIWWDEVPATAAGER